MQTQETNSKSNFKNKAEIIKIADFKTFFKEFTFEIEQNWNKNRHVAQKNRTETPEINTHSYN